ncbi:MAG: hypothetical protein AAF665_02745 [Pseudomonadota bacterium]
MTVVASLKDKESCPLGVETSDAFPVRPPDLDSPASGSWTKDLTAADGHAPLDIDLGEPRDHLSLAFRLRVLDPDGSVVSGSIVVFDGERRWRFVPRSPSAGRSHVVGTGPSHEGHSGNRPGQVFDHPIDAEAKNWVKSVPFHPERLDS